MSERPYSRIYWEVMHDPKFDGVREDVRHFGTWSLMLVVADMAWPAPAFLPPVPKASVAVLAANGLVDVMTGGRFRIHGLDKERGERQERARASASSRGQRPPTGRSATAQQPLIDRSARVTAAPALLDENETSKDEQSQAEQGARDRLDGPLAYYEVTTRYPALHSELHAWTTALADGYGAAVFQKALVTEFTVNRSLKDLLSRTESRLAMEADRTRKANGPIRFDRSAWIEQKRREQEERDGAA